MKLIVNCSNNLGGGGLQVALSFLTESRYFSENEYHVFLSPNVAQQIDQSKFGPNFTFYDIPYVPFWKLGRILSLLEKQIRPEVVFTIFGPAYWQPKAKHLLGYAIPHYIYRDSPFFADLAISNRIKAFFYRQIKIRLFKREADAYVVETDDVNKRLRVLFDTNNVYTVSNTCGTQYFHPESFAQKLPDKQPCEFRLLTLSACYPHKNLEIIPRVIDALGNDTMGKNVRFVLTLKSEDYQRIIPRPYRTRVYNVGPVPAKEGPSIYNECDAMFLPTLLECFSASYPEAMATQRPILTSDLDFAHSICDDAALYFNPSDPSAVAESIIKLVEDASLRQSIVEKGGKRLAVFPTARQRAEHYLELCSALILKH